MITVLKLYDVITTWGIDKETDNNIDFWTFVRRCQGKYQKCNWGDTDPEQKEYNDRLVAQRRDGWLLAKYQYTRGEIYIMTEIDHVEGINQTTIMLDTEFKAKGMNRYSCKQQKFNRHG